MNDRASAGDLDAAVPGAPLKPLSRLHNYRIVEGDPDVRGWGVVGAKGEKVGEVTDLLIDTSAGRVRYLDVALLLERLADEAADTGSPAPHSTAEAPAHGTRHVLIHVENAHLEPEHERVHLANLGAAQLAELPGYAYGGPDGEAGIPDRS